MSITGKELAAMLKVSEAAVSMALNGKPGVSTATRKMILETAKEQGYDFTKLPLNPAKPKSKGNIVFALYRKSGAIVTDNPFFTQLTEGVNEACEKEGYFLNIQYLYEHNDIKGKIKDFVAAGCRGMILLGTEMQTSDLAAFSDAQIPIVLLDCYFADHSADYVLINNSQGAYIATDYLIRKTHKQPGHLKSSYTIQNFLEREDGFYKAVRVNGMSTSRSVVHQVAPSIEGAYSDMMNILANGDALADCYFADNDLIAAGALKAFKESGFKIPKDVQIIGFDDIALCTYMEPAISTIRVPKEHMGETAAKRLFDRIREPKQVNTKVEVETKLILRGTTT